MFKKLRKFLFGEPKPRKAKKEKPVKLTHTDYTNWEKDIGFLTLIMARKKNISKNFYIGIYATQLKDTDYVRDEDIEDIIVSGVKEVMAELSQAYKAYLVDKYFGSEAELAKFVTEDFYVDLTGAAIEQNRTKIRANAVRKRTLDIGRQNLRQEQEQPVRPAGTQKTDLDDEEEGQ
jgi:hypothetical protein